MPCLQEGNGLPPRQDTPKHSFTKSNECNPPPAQPALPDAGSETQVKEEPPTADQPLAYLNDLVAAAAPSIAAAAAAAADGTGMAGEGGAGGRVNPVEGARLAR